MTPPPATDLPLLITFDDGPDPVWTPRFLDILAWRGQRAIFLATGEHANAHPALIVRIVNEGHHLGVHSWNHPHLMTLTVAQRQSQVDITYNKLVSLVGSTAVRWWRAPYGQSDVALDNYAQGKGLRAVGWQAQGSDWAAGIKPAQVESFVESADPGYPGLASDPLVNRATVHPCPPDVATVVLHDGSGENHTANPADRWPGTAVLVSLLDRYPIVDPDEV